MAFWPHMKSETLAFIKHRRRFAKLPTDDTSVFADWKLLPYHRWLRAKRRLIEASPNQDRQTAPTTPDTP